MSDLRRRIVHIKASDWAPQAVPQQNAFTKFAFNGIALPKFPLALSGSAWPKYMVLFAICSAQMAVLLSQYVNHENSIVTREHVNMSSAKTALVLNQLDYSFEVLQSLKNSQYAEVGQPGQNPVAYRAVHQAQEAVSKVGKDDYIMPPPDATDASETVPPNLVGCIKCLQAMADGLEKPMAHPQSSQFDENAGKFANSRWDLKVWQDRLKKYSFDLNHDGVIERQRALFITTLVASLLLTLLTAVMLFRVKPRRMSRQS